MLQGQTKCWTKMPTSINIFNEKEIAVISILFYFFEKRGTRIDKKIKLSE